MVNQAFWHFFSGNFVCFPNFHYNARRDYSFDSVGSSMRSGIIAGIAFCLLFSTVVAAEIEFSSRRYPTSASTQPETTTERWKPEQTALIICDVWDSHHSLNAVRRCVELVPRIEQVATKLRTAGVTIIHAPSGCMKSYAEHPARKVAQTAAPAANLPDDIHLWCNKLPVEEQATYPLDQTAGGVDDDPAEAKLWLERLQQAGRNPQAPWLAQHPGITIHPTDAISDSGTEIWNLLQARGIKQVLICGVHLNMCVLGRPFGIRRLTQHGIKVNLIRDLTDTMYDPKCAPYVSHECGTSLMIDYVERHFCGTVTSTAFVAADPIRLTQDRRRIAMIIGEDEYKTWETLPDFAAKRLQPLGYQIVIVHADATNKNSFPGMAEKIAAADLVLISVRRRTPEKANLDALRTHIASGKPLIGIRTANHAFAVRDPKSFKASEQTDSWQDFDPTIFGSSYTGHHGKDIETQVTLAENTSDHPILRGINIDKLRGHGSLYKVAPLISKQAVPLLLGTIPNKPTEPIAWTNLVGEKQARVFYTSLGHTGDFAQPEFQQLLIGGITWALHRPDWKLTLEECLPKKEK
jgi:type 1 glutamine amidotransferase/nicotinamidase-related amidase